MCFYCNRRIGEEHAWTCVIPRRRVRLRATIEYEADVPRSWDEGTITFVKNEKGCLGNTLQDIELYRERIDREHPNECVVKHPPVEFLGEA